MQIFSEMNDEKCLLFNSLHGLNFDFDQTGLQIQSRKFDILVHKENLF